MLLLATTVPIGIAFLLCSNVEATYQQLRDDIPVSFHQSAYVIQPPRESITSPYVHYSPRKTRHYPCQPRQLHLSLGDEDIIFNKTSITVSFSISSANNKCDPDQVSIQIKYWRLSSVSKYGTIMNVTNTLVNQYNFTSPRTGEAYTSDWLYHVPLNYLYGKTEYWYYVQVRSKDGLHNEKDQALLDTDTSLFQTKYSRRAEVSQADCKNMMTVGCSNVLSFVTAPTASSALIPTKFIIVGDLGQTYNSSVTMLNMLQETKQDHTNTTPATLVMIAGDLSYADSKQSRWDSWLELIEPLISQTPMVATAGNHEIECDLTTHLPFLAFENRFRSPNRVADAIIGPVDESYFNSSSPSTFLGSYDYGNAFYSFSYGLTRTIVLSSYSDTSVGSVQYQWLLGELKKVDRSKTPWLIVMMHTQFYTTFLGHNDELETTIMRESMEPLFTKYHVNLIFSGHDHAYMRSKSMASGKVDKEGLSPIYLIVGEGGNREGHSKSYLNEEAEEWVDVRDKSVFGFGTLEVVNASFSFWRWIMNGEEDSFSDDHWFRNYYHED